MARSGGRRLRWAVLLLTATSFSRAVAPAGAAEVPATTGWWWTGRPSQTFPLKLDPVPAVPKDGLYVAGDPSGPTGVSALRVEIAADTSDVVLSLAVQETIGAPTIDACLAAGPWEASQGGSWDQRPDVDCATVKVSGSISDDGTKIVFALKPLLRIGVLDIVLTPGVSQSANTPATFSTAFRALDKDSLLVTSALRPQIGGTTTVPAASTGGTDTTGRVPVLDPIASIGTTLTPPASQAAPTTTPSPVVRATPTLAATVPEGFEYSVILVLPLLMLSVGSYLGWALNRPVVLRRAGGHAH